MLTIYLPYASLVSACIFLWLQKIESIEGVYHRMEMLKDIMWPAGIEVPF